MPRPQADGQRSGCPRRNADGPRRRPAGRSSACAQLPAGSSLLLMGLAGGERAWLHVRGSCDGPEPWSAAGAAAGAACRLPRGACGDPGARACGAGRAAATRGGQHLTVILGPWWCTQQTLQRAIAAAAAVTCGWTGTCAVQPAGADGGPAASGGCQGAERAIARMQRAHRADSHPSDVVASPSPAASRSPQVPGCCPSPVPLVRPTRRPAAHSKGSSTPAEALKQPSARIRGVRHGQTRPDPWERFQELLLQQTEQQLRCSASAAARAMEAHPALHRRLMSGGGAFRAARALVQVLSLA
jgi:hypothetical protein